MHRGTRFGSVWEYNELKRMLSEAVARGHVEELRALKNPSKIGNPADAWFREIATGEIYELSEFGERGGWWAPVDFTNWPNGTDTIQ